MVDTLSSERSGTQSDEIVDYEPNPYVTTYQAHSASISVPELSLVSQETETLDGSVDENLMNRIRLRSLKEGLTGELLRLLEEEAFEYGVRTAADELIADQMAENALATKTWLNSLFVENFEDPPVIVGLLRLIARLDYYDMYPEGQTMAIAALSHRDTEVQECGVRAFESWTTLHSLKILQNLRVSTQWLQDYIDDVVSDLQEEHRVPVRQED